MARSKKKKPQTVHEHDFVTVFRSMKSHTRTDTDFAAEDRAEGTAQIGRSTEYKLSIFRHDLQMAEVMGTPLPVLEAALTPIAEYSYVAVRVFKSNLRCDRDVSWGSGLDSMAIPTGFTMGTL